VGELQRRWLPHIFLGILLPRSYFGASWRSLPSWRRLGGKLTRMPRAGDAAFFRASWLAPEA
jgi:hypothetical protein